jgi:hypothetical protein
VSYVTRTASGGRFGSLERVRHSERDVLAVVANHIIRKRRAPFFADAFESRLWHRAKDLSDVLAMKDRAYAGHLPGGGNIEFANSTVGNRRLDRNSIQHPRKVEVGGVLRLAAHFAGAINPGRIATDGRCRRDFLCS